MGDVAVASLRLHSSRKAVEGRLMKTDTGQGQNFHSPFMTGTLYWEGEESCTRVRQEP